MIECINWVNMDTAVKNTMRNYSTCIEFQQMQPKDKIILCDIAGKPWEVVGADLFNINRNNFLCIIDYHSKLPVVKQ